LGEELREYRGCVRDVRISYIVCIMEKKCRLKEAALEKGEGWIQRLH